MTIAGVLDSSACPVTCPTCFEWKARWLADGVLDRGPMARALTEVEVAVEVAKLAQFHDYVLVSRCSVRPTGDGLLAMMKELATAPSSIAAMLPLFLQPDSQLFHPIPFPSGGWLRLNSGGNPISAADLPTLDLAATAMMLFRAEAVEASGVLREVRLGGDSEFDQILRGLRRRGYRQALSRHCIVQVEQISDAAPAQKPFVAETPAVRNVLVDRLERCLKRTRSLLNFRHHLPGESTTWLLVDARGISPRYNGTALFGLKIVDEILRLVPSAAILVDEESAEFHHLNERWAANATTSPDWESRYAHAFRINQVWSLDDLRFLHEVASSFSIYMHDIITWDTHPANSELGIAWQSAASHADHIFFNSEFSRVRFLQEFPRSHELSASVVRLSLDPTEYYGHSPSETRDAVVVVGNHYPHKDLVWGEQLVRAAFPYENVISNGGESEDGLMSVELMESLFSRAKVVVFPSHYEGFGIPILEAIGSRSPVVVRDTQVNRELQSLLQSEAMFFFRTSQEMIDAVGIALSSGFTNSANGGDHQHNWATAAEEILSGVQSSLSGQFGVLWSQREWLYNPTIDIREHQ